MNYETTFGVANWREAKQSQYRIATLSTFNFEPGRFSQAQIQLSIN